MKTIIFNNKQINDLLLMPLFKYTFQVTHSTAKVSSIQLSHHPHSLQLPINMEPNNIKQQQQKNQLKILTLNIVCKH